MADEQPDKMWTTDAILQRFGESRARMLAAAFALDYECEYIAGCAEIERRIDALIAESAKEDI